MHHSIVLRCPGPSRPVRDRAWCSTHQSRVAAKEFTKLLPRGLVLFCHADIMSLLRLYGLMDGGVVGTDDQSVRQFNGHQEICYEKGLTDTTIVNMALLTTNDLQL